MASKKDKPNGLSHRQLGSSCFNEAWGYLTKSTLTAAETEEMIHLAHTSFWHWTKVKNHTPQNISIGTWLLSRVYAVAKLPERAKYFAEGCIKISEENAIPPYFRGYAYEAMARAQKLSGESQDATASIEKARTLAEQVENKEERQYLLDDLNNIL